MAQKSSVGKVLDCKCFHYSPLNPDTFPSSCKNLWKACNGMWFCGGITVVLDHTPFSHLSHVPMYQLWVAKAKIFSYEQVTKSALPPQKLTHKKCSECLQMPAQSCYVALEDVHCGAPVIWEDAAVKKVMANLVEVTHWAGKTVWSRKFLQGGVSQTCMVPARHLERNDRVRTRKVIWDPPGQTGSG